MVPSYSLLQYSRIGYLYFVSPHSEFVFVDYIAVLRFQLIYQYSHDRPFKGGLHVGLSFYNTPGWLTYLLSRVPWGAETINRRGRYSCEYLRTEYVNLILWFPL